MKRRRAQEYCVLGRNSAKGEVYIDIELDTFLTLPYAPRARDEVLGKRGHPPEGR
jgi:hypothetical protein